jgi:hypothetical protein
MSINPKSKGTPRRVSPSEAAAALRVPLATFKKLSTLPGAPRRTGKGKLYTLDDWRTFKRKRADEFARVVKEAERAAKLRVRRLRADCELIELRVGALRALYVPAAEVAAAWRRHMAEARAVFERMANSLATRVVGLSLADIQAETSRALDAAILELHTGKRSRDEEHI